MEESEINLLVGLSLLMSVRITMNTSVYIFRQRLSFNDLTRWHGVQVLEYKEIYNDWIVYHKRATDLVNEY